MHHGRLKSPAMRRGLRAMARPKFRVGRLFAGMGAASRVVLVGTHSR